MNRKHARDADSLLLTAGKRQRALVQVVFDFIPDGRLLQAFFDALIDKVFWLLFAKPQTVCHVVIDRKRKRIRLLEHHADLFAQIDDIDVWRIDVLIFKSKASGNRHVLEQIVHAVDAAQIRRFAAAGRSDQGRDLIFMKVHADAVQGFFFAVIKMHVFC